MKMEKEFSLLDSSEEIDDLPPQLFFRNPRLMQEMFDFFDKIKKGKTMKITFPNKKLWKSYNTKLRYYASKYKIATFAFKSIKDNGYFIYIKRGDDKNNTFPK